MTKKKKKVKGLGADLGGGKKQIGLSPLYIKNHSKKRTAPHKLLADFNLFGFGHLIFLKSTAGTTLKYPFLSKAPRV